MVGSVKSSALPADINPRRSWAGRSNRSPTVESSARRSCRTRRAAGERSPVSSRDTASGSVGVAQRSQTALSGAHSSGVSSGARCGAGAEFAAERASGIMGESLVRCRSSLERAFRRHSPSRPLPCSVQRRRCLALSAPRSHDAAIVGQASIRGLPWLAICRGRPQSHQATGPRRT